MNPVHQYVEDELKNVLVLLPLLLVQADMKPWQRQKDKFNGIRVRYDAIKAKPGSTQEKEKEELRKELDKAGAECLAEMQRVYNHSEVRFPAPLRIRSLPM